MEKVTKGVNKWVAKFKDAGRMGHVFVDQAAATERSMCSNFVPTTPLICSDGNHVFTMECETDNYQFLKSICPTQPTGEDQLYGIFEATDGAIFCFLLTLAPGSELNRKNYNAVPCDAETTKRIALWYIEQKEQYLKQARAWYHRRRHKRNRK